MGRKGVAIGMQTTLRFSNLSRTIITALLAVLGLLVGSQAASAAAPADPQGGAAPVPPHFYNGNVEAIRSAGSDTTLFLMQRIGDLYSNAGLYGCGLNTSAGQTLYNTSDPASATTNEYFYCQAGQNVVTTDVNDNWDHTEVYQGLDAIGSGPGQSQLCNALSTPLTVDFARSAKPAGTACSTLASVGYGKDGIPILEYPVNPTTYGTSTTTPYSSINGGVVGPVSQGWLPGDPNGGPYTGTPLTNISNADNGGGASSTAYRIWCASNATRISDWGALTNLGPSLLITGVSLNSGSPTATISGSFPLDGRQRPSHHRSGRPQWHHDPVGVGRDAHALAKRLQHGDGQCAHHHHEHIGRRAGCSDRRADPGHGHQHRRRRRVHLRQLRQLRCQRGRLRVEHEHQRGP